MGSGRAFGVMFGARIAAAGVAFLASILVARYLGPERFGPYAVFLATLNVATSLFSPALDTGMVRFAARARDASHAVVAYFFRIKAVLAVATLVVGGALAVPLHGLLISSPGIHTPGPSAFAVVFASAAIMLLWSSVLAWRQSQQHFLHFAFQELGTSMLRLAWIAGVMLIGLGERTLLAGYGAAACIIAAAGALTMPRAIWRAPIPPRETRRAIVHFTKWVLLAGAAAALAHRLDLFLLAALDTPPAALGHYGAALNLALVGELAVMSLFHVLLPMASALSTPAERRSFLKRHQMRAILLGMLLLPLVPAGGPLAVLLFGEDFAAAGLYFGPLIAGLAFTLASAPANAVLYAAGHGRTVAVLEWLKVLAILTAGLAAVPFWGPLGMACAVAVARGAAAILAYAAAHALFGRDARSRRG